MDRLSHTQTFLIVLLRETDCAAVSLTLVKALAELAIAFGLQVHSSLAEACEALCSKMPNFSVVGGLGNRIYSHALYNMSVLALRALLPRNEGANISRSILALRTWHCHTSGGYCLGIICYIINDAILIIILFILLR